MAVSLPVITIPASCISNPRLGGLFDSQSGKVHPSTLWPDTILQNENATIKRENKRTQMYFTTDSSVQRHLREQNYYTDFSQDLTLYDHSNEKSSHEKESSMRSNNTVSLVHELETHCTILTMSECTEENVMNEDVLKKIKGDQPIATHVITQINYGTKVEFKFLLNESEKTKYSQQEEKGESSSFFHSSKWHNQKTTYSFDQLKTAQFEIKAEGINIFHCKYPEKYENAIKLVDQEMKKMIGNNFRDAVPVSVVLTPLVFFVGDNSQKRLQSVILKQEKLRKARQEFLHRILGKDVEISEFIFVMKKTHTACQFDSFRHEISKECKAIENKREEILEKLTRLKSDDPDGLHDISQSFFELHNTVFEKGSWWNDVIVELGTLCKISEQLKKSSTEYSLFQVIDVPSLKSFEELPMRGSAVLFHIPYRDFNGVRNEWFKNADVMREVKECMTTITHYMKQDRIGTTYWFTRMGSHPTLKIRATDMLAFYKDGRKIDIKEFERALQEPYQSLDYWINCKGVDEQCLLQIIEAKVKKRLEPVKEECQRRLKESEQKLTELKEKHRSKEITWKKKLEDSFLPKLGENKWKDLLIEMRNQYSKENDEKNKEIESLNKRIQDLQDIVDNEKMEIISMKRLEEEKAVRMEQILGLKQEELSEQKGILVKMNRVNDSLQEQMFANEDTIMTLNDKNQHLEAEVKEWKDRIKSLDEANLSLQAKLTQQNDSITSLNEKNLCSQSQLREQSEKNNKLDIENASLQKELLESKDAADILRHENIFLEETLEKIVKDTVEQHMAAVEPLDTVDKHIAAVELLEVWGINTIQDSFQRVLLSLGNIIDVMMRLLSYKYIPYHILMSQAPKLKLWSRHILFGMHEALWKADALEIEIHEILAKLKVEERVLKEKLDHERTKLKERSPINEATTGVIRKFGLDAFIPNNVTYAAVKVFLQKSCDHLENKVANLLHQTDMQESLLNRLVAYCNFFGTVVRQVEVLNGEIQSFHNCELIVKHLANLSRICLSKENCCKELLVDSRVSWNDLSQKMEMLSSSHKQWQSLVDNLKDFDSGDIFAAIGPEVKRQCAMHEIEEFRKSVSLLNLITLAPSSMLLLGEIVLVVGEFENFSMEVKENTAGDYKYQEHTKSLKYGLLQVSCEGYEAFRKAHECIHTILLSTSQMQIHIKRMMQMIIGNPINDNNSVQQLTKCVQRCVEMCNDTSTKFDLVENMITKLDKGCQYKFTMTEKERKEMNKIKEVLNSSVKTLSNVAANWQKLAQFASAVNVDLLELLACIATDNKEINDHMRHKIYTTAFRVSLKTQLAYEGSRIYHAISTKHLMPIVIPLLELSACIQPDTCKQFEEKLKEIPPIIEFIRNKVEEEIEQMMKNVLGLVDC